MVTSNRRVAAYFPAQIDDAFKAFKVKNGFATEDEPNSNDSKALIEIVSKFLDVEYQEAHLVSLPENLVTQDQLEELQSEVNKKISEFRGELLSKLSLLNETRIGTTIGNKGASSDSASQDTKAPSDDEVGMHEPLSVKDLASRIGIHRTTLSGWKTYKKGCHTAQELTENIRKKDPDRLSWVWDKSIRKFRVMDVDSSNLLTGSQGKLLDE